MSDGEVAGLLELVAPNLGKPKSHTDAAYAHATEQARLAAICKSLKAEGHSWRGLAKFIRQSEGLTYSYVHLRSLVRKLAKGEGVFGFLSKKYLCGPPPLLTAREILEVLWLSTDNAWMNHKKLHDELKKRWQARGKKPRFVPKYHTIHALIGLMDESVEDLFVGRLKDYHEKHALVAPRYYPRVYHTWQLDEHVVKLLSTHETRKLPFQPRLIVALDCVSRVITGARLLVGKSTIEHNLALIYEAARFKDDPEEIIHGLPENLQTDNEVFFKNRSMQFSLRYLGVVPIYIGNDHPQENGRVERFFRTIESDFFAGFRSYVRRKCSQRQRRRDAVPFALLEKLLAEWVHAYNYEHIHSAHKRTPIEVYREHRQATAEPIPNNEELRKKFCLHDSLKVERQGITQDGVTYNAPVLTNLVGQYVNVLKPVLYEAPPAIAILRLETDQPQIVPRVEPSNGAQCAAIRAASRAQTQRLKDAKSLLKNATPALETSAPNWGDSQSVKAPEASAKPPTAKRTPKHSKPAPQPPPQPHVWDAAPIY